MTPLGRRHFPALTCMAMLAASVAPAPGQDADLSRRLHTQQSVLRQVAADLAEARADADRIRGAERDAAREAVAAANQVGLIEHSLAELARAESLLSADIAEAGARRTRIQQQVDARQSLVERRVRVLYVQGRRQPYQRALLATSLTHWLAARQYLATLNRRDTIDIEHLKKDRARVDSLRLLLREQQGTLDTLIARKQEQYGELQGAERQAQRLLAMVRRDGRLAEQAAAELEAQKQASRRRIEGYLAALAQAGAQAGDNPFIGGVSVTSPVDFSAEKGHLPWPVRGEVVRRFGRQRDSQTRTWTRTRGIDIRASNGTDVLCVAAGQVVMVDWYRGYGAFVIVAHGQDYYTLYAHLKAVAVRRDDHVRQGQVIGASGESLGEGRLHFELLAGHEALNPLDWLAPSPAGSL